MSKRKLNNKIKRLEGEIRVQTSVLEKWFSLYVRAMKHNANLTQNLEETYTQLDVALDLIKKQAELIEELR